MYMTERERIISVLKRQKPDRVPWATRLDIWFGSHSRTGDLPVKYQNVDLMRIYDDLNVGRQSYVRIANMKLHQVEMVVDFNDQEVYREHAPVLPFPDARDFVPRIEPGETTVTFKTPVGNTHVRYATNPEILEGYLQPFLRCRILNDERDYPIVQWILSHAEVVPNYDAFVAREAEIGEKGLTIGMMDRVPFQRILLDFLGEERCFYEMVDHPARFMHLYDQLSEIDQEYIRIALKAPAFMVEYGDNFDGQMTNPRLFKKYCLAHLQEASEKIHAVGKVFGSHMDGDMHHLIDLVLETGLDVVESFSPAPLTSVSFDRAWEVWNNNVIMWGAIPSIIFEDETPPDLFEHEVMNILTTVVPDGFIILGIGDQAVQRTRPDRIQYVAKLLEHHGYYKS
jgi:uroporphyrinogen-III decarboxylase